jgi:FkbM family methyltransferase
MIERLIEQFSENPFDASLSLSIAQEYEKLQQIASAVSFYLRAAEYGSGDIVYTALLKMSYCFEAQGDREATVLNNAYQALQYNPDRPEAYFRLSQINEHKGNWQQAYTYASLGIDLAKTESPLPISIGYYAKYCLMFQKAISAFWIGRKSECITILTSLKNMDMVPEYVNIVNYNMEKLGLIESDNMINPLEPVVTNYRKYYGIKATTVFDIGTRDGKDAEYLAKKLKSDNTYAIDANPIAIEKTKTSYPWMNVIETAVSDFDGTATFQQVNSGNEGMDGCSSIYAQKVENESHFDGLVNIIPTNVIRMDTLMTNKNIQIIDVVKIDVEGYTWEVLQGFGEKLHNIKLFHLETEKESTHPNHKNTFEIEKFMNENGFVLVDRSYEGSGGINGGIEDQIWVNPKLAIMNTDCF